jgi:hypothetical protein
VQAKKCTFLKLVEEKLSFNSFSKENYKTVSTEKFGLLLFSKYIEKPSAGNFEKNTEVYAVASTSIESNNNEIKLFSSDIILRYQDRI